jgi:dipeptidyl aminopeptidase/acylaminoacyl peptidase
MRSSFMIFSILLFASTFMTTEISLGQNAAGQSGAKRPMALADLFALKRVADPQISPDGTQVVYVVTTVNLESNKSSSNLWLAAIDGKSPPRQLTTTDKKDGHPRWSPDGKTILFESSRSGSSQLWVIDTTGGEAKKITEISSGAGTAIWSPDGKRIAFVSAVFPEFSELPFEQSDAKNKEKSEAIEKDPVKAKVFTKLFFRHWDSFVDDKRQHLFVVDADGKNCRDVTPGDRDAYPTSTTFSVGDDFTFAPDSKHLIFTAVPEQDEAWSTNHDLCRVSIDNKSTKWETLTKGNDAADGCPRFSPDGKMLAYRAQSRTGYEADFWAVKVVECDAAGGDWKPVKAAAQNSPNVDDLAWAGNQKIFTSSEDRGYRRFYTMGVGSEGPIVKGAETEGSRTSLSVSRDGAAIAFTEARMDRPNDVFAVSPTTDGVSTNLSQANKDLLSTLDLPRPEYVEVPVEGDVKMQMWILKPPGFDAKKKWPLAYLVHGGPQGMWDDGWSFRWNAQVWAAQGYVVALPNPRGSSSFGQKYMDDISGDWGGKCYNDLVAGLAHLKSLPYVDANRMASAGGSFGGYMQNWFAVNEIAKEFKCLVTHCSVWDFESMWGTTDELWFDEWEHGLPWSPKPNVAEHSPHKKSGNLGKYKTPMLIIHNDLDFRCPIGQGHELFTALQRQGVPSRFVNFPDEGHWVLKPQNSKRWHEEVFAWLKQYAPPGGK